MEGAEREVGGVVRCRGSRNWIGRNRQRETDRQRQRQARSCAGIGCVRCECAFVFFTPRVFVFCGSVLVFVFWCRRMCGVCVVCGFGFVCALFSAF